jgi:CheY-like chemotaxis protein
MPPETTDGRSLQTDYEDLLERLWAEPEEDVPPEEQLLEELESLPEVLEEPDMVRLTRIMRAVILAVRDEQVVWGEQIYGGMADGADAISEALDPNPPRLKLEEASGTSEDEAEPLSAEQAQAEAEAQQADHARSALANLENIFAMGDPHGPIIWVGGDDLEEEVHAALTAFPGHDFKTLSPNQAQTVLTGMHPALVVAGWQTGFPVLSAFRQEDYLTPFVVLANWPITREQHREAVATGANRVLSKPLTRDKVVATLRPLLTDSESG